MAHFFLASTHNNLCLSLAVIVQEGLKNAHIVYLKPSGHDKEFLYFFRNHVNELGVTVSFPCERPVRSKSERQDDKVYSRRIKSAIKKLKKRKESCSYYFFDDRSIESQYVNRKIVKRTDKTFLVQDEMNFFKSHLNKTLTFLEKLLLKIKHGFYLKDLKQVGDLRKYDGLYCLKPEDMLDRYKSLTRINHLQTKALFNTYLRNVSAALFKQKYDDFFDLTERDTLVFLPKLDNPDMVTGLKVELLHKFAGQKYPQKFHIKNHSESKILFTTNDIGHGLKFIPNGIPDLCFFIFNEEKGLSYFLPPSASLLMVKLNNSSNKVSLIHAAENFEQNQVQ